MKARWIHRQLTDAPDGPRVVLREQDRADETNDSVLVWEDAHDLGMRLISPLTLSIGSGECSLARCCAGRLI